MLIPLHQTTNPNPINALNGDKKDTNQKKVLNLIAVQIRNLTLTSQTNGKHKIRHSHIRNNKDNKTYILLTGNNHQIISRPYTEGINRKQTTTVMIYN